MRGLFVESFARCFFLFLVSAWLAVCASSGSQGLLASLGFGRLVRVSYCSLFVFFMRVSFRSDGLDAEWWCWRRTWLFSPLGVDELDLFSRPFIGGAS